MQHIEIGDFRITMVRAGSYWWDGGTMFGVIPKTIWSQTQPADEMNRIDCGFNCFVIENGDHRILVETGGGVRHDEVYKERTRMANPPVLREVLAAHGFEPSSFDYVINTHLHWDHASGNTTDEGGRAVPTLPNAIYVVQRGELAEARNPHPRVAVSYKPVNFEPLVEAGRMRLVDGDVELLPGVDLRVAPGHNLDMMVVIVRSKGETWCQFADLIQFAAQIKPTWTGGFDLYPVKSIESRMELLPRAVEEGWWCSFGHDPDVNFARIQNEGNKWKTITR